MQSGHRHKGVGRLRTVSTENGAGRSSLPARIFVTKLSGFSHAQLPVEQPGQTETISPTLTSSFAETIGATACLRAEAPRVKT